MGLLDVLLQMSQRQKTFSQASSPASPSYPNGLAYGDGGGDGDNVRHGLFTCPDAELQGLAPTPSPDPYAERMQAALSEINRSDYPAGMVLWLRDARPDLYRELTEILPEQIHYLWSQHKPPEEFEQVLNGLVETHRLACDLYGEAMWARPPTSFFGRFPANP